MKILPFLLLLATSLASFAQTDSARPPDLMKAIRIYHTGNYGGAIVSLNRAAEAAPKNSEVYLYYALCYMGKDDDKEAMRNFNKAIELNPKLKEAFKGRGKLKARLYDYQGSIMDFDKALEVDSTYSDAYFNRGLAHFNLKDYEASINDFTQVIGLNAKDFEAYYARGKAHDAAGKTSNACKDWSKSAELGFFDAYDVIKMKCN
jgi:tetratricopeptide (TPR) repeat protein